MHVRSEKIFTPQGMLEEVEKKPNLDFVSPSILQEKKLKLAHIIETKQREVLFSYAQEKGVFKDTIERFLKVLEM